MIAYLMFSSICQLFIIVPSAPFCAYSICTGHSYVAWIRRFILFHGKRHPAEMGQAEVEAFLTDLPVRGKVSASTQNQAFCGTLFLNKSVLSMDVLKHLDAVRAKRLLRLPTAYPFTVKGAPAGLFRPML